MVPTLLLRAHWHAALAQLVLVGVLLLYLKEWGGPRGVGIYIERGKGKKQSTFELLILFYFLLYF